MADLGRRKGKDWAARKGVWKLVGSEPATASLYNLSDDIGETRDRAQRNPEIVEKLMDAFEGWETEVEQGWAK